MTVNSHVGSVLCSHMGADVPATTTKSRQCRQEQPDNPRVTTRVTKTNGESAPKRTTTNPDASFFTVSLATTMVDDDSTVGGTFTNSSEIQSSKTVPKWWKLRANWLRLPIIGIPLAVIAVIIIALVGLVSLVVSIPSYLVGSLLSAIVAASLNLIVEHAYMLRFGSAHATLARLVMQKFERLWWHSRFVDCRVDVVVQTRPLSVGFDIENPVPSGVISSRSFPAYIEGQVSIHAIPCLTDNLSYVVVDRESCHRDNQGQYYSACVIDVGDAMAIVDALPELSRLHYNDIPIHLEAILTTHKHWDHQAGNKELKRQCPSILHIYGSYLDKVLGCTNPVKGGDTISVTQLLQWNVVHAPGHTRGSVMFLLKGKDGRDVLMTGDILFSGGCGACFEGDATDTMKSAITVVSCCSPDSLLFPGHEYTYPLLTEQMKSQSWGKLPPSQFFTLAGLYFNVLHRRVMKKGDKLLTVPVALKDEVVLNPILRTLYSRCGVLIAMVKLALENQTGNFPPDGLRSEREVVQDDSKSGFTVQSKRSSESLEGDSESGSCVEKKQPVGCDCTSHVSVVKHHLVQNPFTVYYTWDIQDLKQRILQGNMTPQEIVRALEVARSGMDQPLHSHAGPSAMRATSGQSGAKAIATSSSAAGEQNGIRDKNGPDPDLVRDQTPATVGSWLDSIDIVSATTCISFAGTPRTESKWKRNDTVLRDQLESKQDEPMISRERISGLLAAANVSQLNQNDQQGLDITPLWPNTPELQEVSLTHAFFLLAGKPPLSMLDRIVEDIESRAGSRANSETSQHSAVIPADHDGKHHASFVQDENGQTSLFHTAEQLYTIKDKRNIGLTGEAKGWGQRLLELLRSPCTSCTVECGFGPMPEKFPTHTHNLHSCRLCQHMYHAEHIDESSASSHGTSSSTFLQQS